MTPPAWKRATMPAVAKALAQVSPWSWTILLGLVLCAVGLAAIYWPLAPLGVGSFLLWFTTMRRVEG